MNTYLYAESNYTSPQKLSVVHNLVNRAVSLSQPYNLHTDTKICVKVNFKNGCSLILFSLSMYSENVKKALQCSFSSVANNCKSQFDVQIENDLS